MIFKAIRALALCCLPVAAVLAEAEDHDAELKNLLSLPDSLTKYTEYPHSVIGRTVLMCTLIVDQKTMEEDLADFEERYGVHAQGRVFFEMDVYVNDSALQAIKNEAPYPVGSVVIKKLLQETPHGKLVGGMIKREAGYDPEHQDWEYFLELDGEVKAGPLPACRDCHSRSDNYVFGEWIKAAAHSSQ